MGAFIASLSAFSSLPGRAQGLCRAVEARRVRGAGHGAAGALPRGAGGVSFAWLLPISFTSGWNRWRGGGWKSPSGWESHKCVNKCDDQSLLRCSGNSGLSRGECQAPCSSPHPRAGLSGEEKLWKRSFSKENSCSLSCYSYFCFK